MATAHGEDMPLLKEQEGDACEPRSKKETSREEFLSTFWVLFCSSACAVIALPFAFGS